MIISVNNYDSAIPENLFAQTSQDSTICHTRENSEMFTLTSKYFKFSNNYPTASLVDFVKCYSCLSYSSMDWSVHKYSSAYNIFSSLFSFSVINYFRHQIWFAVVQNCIQNSLRYLFVKHIYAETVNIFLQKCPTYTNDKVLSTSLLCLIFFWLDFFRYFC